MSSKSIEMKETYTFEQIFKLTKQNAGEKCIGKLRHFLQCK